MPDYSLVPVDYEPDLSGCSLVPLDYRSTTEASRKLHEAA
jgi:hypothetical protein